MKANLKRGLMLSPLLAAPALVHMSAYANTLTGLTGQLYAAVDVVSRELVGFIPSVTRNFAAERAALGQDVTYPITGAQVAYDVTPAMSVPEPPDAVVGNGVMKITKSRAVPFGWTGEQQREVNNGVGYLSIQAELFAQALRVLVNEMERDLAVEAALNASRFYGTPGTTPFATNLADTAQLRKILDDNGAPLTGRAFVMDTAAGAALRTLQNLTRANEAGTTMTLRDGELLNIHGFSMHESAGVQARASGTGADAVTTNAGFAKGATTIALGAGGTGTILAGDVVTFAGDPNQYVVKTGVAAANTGSIVLQAPGLRQAIPASATAITVKAAGTPNVGFSPDALHLIARAPALPNEGDMALDRMNITDVRSGLVFEVSLYPGYRKVRAEVAMAWGVKAVKPAHIAGLWG